MRKVMVFGTFDIVHPGHLNFFRQARKYGDYLIAVVGRDKIVEQVKGRKPRHNERERLRKVSAIATVDRAVLGRLDDKYSIIEELKPDVICLGYDQDSFSEKLPEELIKRGIKATIVRMEKYRHYSSSLLKARACRSGQTGTVQGRVA